METYLGLDFGGTKLLIGEVDSEGQILKSKRYDTGYMNQDQATELIKDSLSDYARTVGWATDKAPVAMGVGLPGRINNDDGLWMQFDTKRSTPIPLAEELNRITGLPCYLDNDVKSATRAEQIWGHGKESDNFIYINVGTGLACGTVVNGRLVRGSHYNAGEIGHTMVGVHNGVTCCCGRTDCVETIVSGVGFDLSARALKDKYTTALSIPDDPSVRVSVAEIYELYGKNDPLAVELVENASTALANLIMNLVRVADPDTVVLGGGIVSSGLMYEKVLAKLHPGTMRFVSHGVVLTKLNPNFVGLLGAAAVAMNQ